jgi:uncharacterized protein YcfL
MFSIKKLSCLFISLTLVACASIRSGSKAEKQQKILTMKESVLTKLFATKPDTRSQINAAPGYAVFSNANINLIFMAAGTGYGVVKDMNSNKNTYIKMKI